jgi:hypothetical protein
MKKNLLMATMALCFSATVVADGHGSSSNELIFKAEVERQCVMVIEKDNKEGDLLLKDISGEYEIEADNATFTVISNDSEQVLVKSLNFSHTLGSGLDDDLFKFVFNNDTTVTPTVSKMEDGYPVVPNKPQQVHMRVDMKSIDLTPGDYKATVIFEVDCED